MKIRKSKFLKFWKYKDNLCYGNYFIINTTNLMLILFIIIFGLTIIYLNLKFYYLSIISLILAIIIFILIYKDFKESIKLK